MSVGVTTDQKQTNKKGDLLSLMLLFKIDKLR
jgi:hypothetical protein